MNNTPRLIKKNIDQFNLDGYSVIENIFSPDECENLIKKIKKIANQSKTYTGGYLRESNIIELDLSFANLINHPVMMQICKELLGEHFRLMSSEALIRTKEEDDPVRWHEDGPNTPSYRDITSPPSLFQLKFGIFLNDILENNSGNLTVIKGSHLYKTSPFNQNMEEYEDKKIQIKAKKGSLIFFHNSLWHCVSRNLKDDARYNLYYTYCYPWMAPFDRSASSLFLRSILNYDQKKLLMDFETPSNNYTLIKETWRGNKKLAAKSFKNMLIELAINRLKVLKRKILGGSLN